MSFSSYLIALAKSILASFGARALHAPGMEFDTFGRWIGLQLAARGWSSRSLSPACEDWDSGGVST